MVGQPPTLNQFVQVALAAGEVAGVVLDDAAIECDSGALQLHVSFGAQALGRRLAERLDVLLFKIQAHVPKRVYAGGN